MKEELKIINSKMLDEIKNINNIKELNELKVAYQGKKGIITELLSKMKELPNEEKKEYGMQVNELRNNFNTIYEEKMKELNEKELNEKLCLEEIYSNPEKSIEINNEIKLNEEKLESLYSNWEELSL